MHRVLSIVVFAVLLATALPSLADLQNVQVGGEIRIRGDWVRNTLTTTPIEVRFTPDQVRGRSIGGPFEDLGVVSIMDWDKRGNDLKLIEQRTRLNVKADFTDQVNAFIELDSYDIWGEDFRSNYLTGVDSRASAGVTDTVLGKDGDVEVFQAYVEANEVFGVPLRVRIGRQELSFGSEFLVGNGDKAPLFRGISFDAVRLTYATDKFSVDGWWSKLVENSPLEEDGDVDFYGIYASCKAVENITFDAYWLYLRDARAVRDALPNSLTDYGPTNLHTVGLRGAGKIDAFDFEAELAYQFGNVDLLGSTFSPWGIGDDSPYANNWGGRLEGGYTFDVMWHPRIFAGFMYFGGEDNRQLTYDEWLHPHLKGRASVSFNRLFSDQIYSGFVDLNDDFSNGYDLRIGTNFMPTDKLMAMFCVSYFRSLEGFDNPRPGEDPFLTTGNSGYLGTEAYLALFYQYSANLMFEAGWAHWFTGAGSREGEFTAWNGLMFTGGSDDDDGDYIYVGSKLTF